MQADEGGANKKVRSTDEHVGIVMEVCLHGTVQDFLASTRAIFDSPRCRLGVGRPGCGTRSYTLVGPRCATEEEAMSLLYINSWSTRLRIAREIAEALAACHAANIMHRDLTSYNIMLTESIATNGFSGTLSWQAERSSHSSDGDTNVHFSNPWSIRLIDFGLSALGQLDGQQQGPRTRSISMHSPAWMGPECYNNNTHEPASDVYSFGIVLWELCVLSSPTSKLFPHGSLMPDQQAYERHLRQLAKVVSVQESAQELKGVPCCVLDKLCDLIRACIHVDVALRPPAAEVACCLFELELLCKDRMAGAVPSSDGVKPAFMTTEGMEQLVELRRNMPGNGDCDQ